MAMQRSGTFASLLKRHRDAAGLTQEELAGRAGIGTRTISNLERGVNKSPHRSTLRRIAVALELSEVTTEELAASARGSVEVPSPSQWTPIEGGFLGAMPTARLVARGKELGRVLDALKAAEGGSGRLVLLAGEPGIGKTRLAQEISVHAWEHGFLVTAGRCYEAQGGVPFYPFLEAISTIYEETSPAIRGEIPERWPYLARLLPDRFPPQIVASSESQEESQRLLRAVTGYVREVSALRPVALLLDDLHFADGASLDLLAHLSRHTRGDRVLLVGTYRDVEIGSGHPLRKAVGELGREQLLDKVDVGRLGPEGTAELVSDRLDGAEEVFAPGEAERHYRNALGLAEEVGDDPMAAEASEKLGGVLATTVRYEEALRALERASGIHRARNDLESASRVEARIAQTHFRQGTKDQGAARLSAHLKSLDRPGATEGARRTMAELYCALARLYWARVRFAASLEAAERAASLSRELGDARSLADAQMVRGSALLWLDAHDEGMEVLEESAALAEDADALDTLSTALSFLHWAYVLRGEFDRGRECGERGAAIAYKAGDTDALALHTSTIGLGLYYLGEWGEASSHLERSVRLTRSRPPSFFSGIPLACLGTLRLAEGAWKDATRCLSEASMAREAQSPEFRGYVQTLLAQLDLLRGRPGETLARLEPYARDPTSVRDAPTLSVLAEAYAEAGDVAKAEEAVVLALRRVDLMRNRVSGVEVSRVRAKILTRRGRTEEAKAVLEDALRAARSMPYPYAEGKILCEYGLLHIDEREPERALERFSAALDIFLRLGAKKYAAQTLQELGRS